MAWMASGVLGGRGARARAALMAWSLCAGLTALGCSDDDDSSSTSSALAPQEVDNIAIAKRVLTEGLVGGDTAVVEQLVREDYRQHNAQAETGRQGLLDFIAFLQTQEGNAVEFHRELADGDLVALHSTYGTGANRTVAFDVFRIIDGQLAEHWDALTPWVDPSESESGNSLVDGETRVTDRDRTEANRELVTDIVQDMFIDGNVDVQRVLTSFALDFVHHNPDVQQGPMGIVEYFQGGDAQPIGYESIELVVADGNFVLVGSEGFRGGADDYAVFYDLFRVSDGRIAEHWNIVQNIDLDAVPHDNGLF